MKKFSVMVLLLPVFLYSQQMGSTTLEVRHLPTPVLIDNDIENFVNQFPESKTFTAAEREWFYWTNYSRMNPKRFWDSVIAPILAVYPKFRNSYTVSLQKELYASPSLQLVRPNDKLKQAATALVKDLEVNKSLPAHTSSNGETFQERMTKIKITTCAGENISFGSSNTLLMLALLYIDEGVPEHGHRKALLNPLFVQMGIGVAVYPDNNFMVVQDFACLQD